MKEYVGFISVENEVCIDERQPIVRCRDCKWYCEEWNRKLMRDTISCDWFDGAHVKPYGFCAWGERKD